MPGESLGISSSGHSRDSMGPATKTSYEYELGVSGMTTTALENPRSKTRLIAILIALDLSLFISALDQTIIATAVPTIASDLNSSSGYVWIGGAYLLAIAAAGPIWTKLSDIWGRKPILLAAVALFFASSTICGLASDMKMLIAGRALQGTAGGGIMQIVIITISDIFSMSRSLYLGLLEMMWWIAGGLGPPLGGIFTEKLSWRWCFWIGLPVSGTAFFLLLIFLDIHNPRTPMIDGFKAIDWFGSLSILGLMLMLLIGLDFGGQRIHGIPHRSYLVVFGAFMSVFFFFSEKKLAKYPLMPLGMFNKRSNVACLVLGFVHGMVFIAGEYYLPLYFQSALEASPLHSGILILPITITQAIMGILVGMIIHRTGRYLEVIYVGVVLMTVGNGLYILLSPTSSLSAIIGFQIVAGLGAALQEDTASATSTFGFVRNLATSLSIVIAGVIFQNSMGNQIPPLSAPPINLPENITSMFTGSAAAANVVIIVYINDPAQKAAVKGAFAGSLRNTWISLAVISATAVVASLFIQSHILSEEHVETKTGIKNTG